MSAVPGSLRANIRAKGLNFSLKSSAGRNFTGRQTFFHKGGRSKLRYRAVDFYRTLENVPAIVRRIEYDPSRTAAVALVAYANELVSYIIASHKLAVGQIVLSKDSLALESHRYLSEGCAHTLGSIPVGNYVHSVELKPGRGGQLMRAYNSSALLLRHMVGYSILKLKSGEHRRLSSQCMATLGVPTRVLHKERQDFLRRAGLNRYKGRRPHVRGCAMNPVDHPHGGNTSSKFGSFTPWGKVAKGVRTASRYRPGRGGILKYRVRNYDARIEKLNKK